jgi:hypothetical protein
VDDCALNHFFAPSNLSFQEHFRRCSSAFPWALVNPNFPFHPASSCPFVSLPTVIKNYRSELPKLARLPEEEFENLSVLDSRSGFVEGLEMGKVFVFFLFPLGEEG